MRNMVREGKVYQTHPKELLILFSQLLIALLLGEDRKMHFVECSLSEHPTTPTNLRIKSKLTSIADKVFHDLTSTFLSNPPYILHQPL